MASCGSTRKMEGTGKVNAQNRKTETKLRMHAEAAAVKNLAFVQKVADNQVYAKNIVGNMTFNLQAGGKDITVPGKLQHAQGRGNSHPALYSYPGSEVGRIWSLPLTMCSSSTACTRNISRQTIRRWISCKKQGINFYSLQALFWNQLLVPGVKKVSDSDLKKFDANLDETGENVPVTIKYGNMSYTWKASRSSGRITEANVMYKDSRHRAHLRDQHPVCQLQERRRKDVPSLSAA